MDSDRVRSVSHRAIGAGKKVLVRYRNGTMITGFVLNPGRWERDHHSLILSGNVGIPHGEIQTITSL